MAGPPVRERYNAKARGSVAGGSAGHKKRKRPASKPRVEGSDVEMEESVKVAEPVGGGMSSKKRKRMESYIVRWSYG
jgi:ATP-dependent RNA helicase DHX37/DHR1